jgi:SseB protein N-terminal domain
VSAPWQPANATERMISEALSRGDRREYFRLLAAADLYVPAFVPPAEEGAEPALSKWITADLDGHTFLLVFTSVEGLTSRLGELTNGYAVTDYPQLRSTWPDPEWLLAVNPDLALDAYVPIDAIDAAASGDLLIPTVSELLTALDVADLLPQNAVENAMLAALDAQDVDAYVEALLLADVLVPTTEEVMDVEAAFEQGFPWHNHGSEDSPAIAVFTSERALAHVHPEAVPVVTVPFLFVASGWPAGAHRLLVNPGTALGLDLPGAEVSALLFWANKAALPSD